MAPFKDHFSKLAAQYAAFRPRYPQTLFEYLAGLCSQRQMVWDCACGSGQASVDLAAFFERVVATDASAKQVEAATPHPRIEYRVAPAEQSGLPAESVDLITVAQALHWFDLDRFYAEARRVLRPDGLLAVWTYGVQSVEGDAMEREVAAFRAAVEPYWPPERRLVESGYRTIPFPFMEITPPQLSLQEAWPLPHLMGYLRSWSSTGRFVAEHGLDPVAELESKLEPLWGPPEQPRLVTWPLALRVGRNS